MTDPKGHRDSPATGYRFSSATPDFSRTARPAGPWIRVEGGDLSTPVELRVHRDAGGRVVVTGLMIGEEFKPREITSQTLREIKIREILAELFNEYDPDAPPDWTNFASTVAIVTSANVTGGHVAKSQFRGPGEEALQAFAHTYLAELGRQPQRAMSAAAKAHNISRATANRWARECRQLGYLPSKVHAIEKGRESR